MISRSSHGNRLVSILVKYQICEKFVCTTCGGSFLSLERLRKDLPPHKELIDELKRLTGDDLLKLKDRSNSLPHLFDEFVKPECEEVLETWAKRAENEPKLAIGVLSWREHEKVLPACMIQRFIYLSETELLRGRAIREKILCLMPVWVEWPPRVLEAFEKDRDADRQREKLAQEDAIRRVEHLKRISPLPFRERVSRILEEPTLQPHEWREDWGNFEDEELRGLSPKEVQELIDKCASKHSHRWVAALKMLYEKRHQYRLSAMDALRQKYGHLQPQNQLQILLNNHEIPIEHYPAELAKSATSEWIFSLEPNEKNRFQELLSDTRLRLWRKILKKL